MLSRMIPILMVGNLLDIFFVPPPGGARDRGHKQSRLATLREPRLCTRQATLSILFERCRCATIEAMAPMNANRQ